MNYSTSMLVVLIFLATVSCASSPKVYSDMCDLIEQPVSGGAVDQEAAFIGSDGYHVMKIGSSGCDGFFDVSTRELSAESISLIQREIELRKVGDDYAFGIIRVQVSGYASRISDGRFFEFVLTDVSLLPDAGAIPLEVKQSLMGPSAPQR